MVDVILIHNFILSATALVKISFKPTPHTNKAITPAKPPAAPRTACAVFIAPAVDCVLVTAILVPSVAAVLVIGLSSGVVDPVLALDVCVALVDSSSLVELLLVCRVDEGRGRPPPLLKAVGLDECTEPDALSETPVGVASTCTLVLVEPHT